MLRSPALFGKRNAAAMAALLAVSPVSSLIAGCGGGKAITAAPLATRLRDLQTGDNWTYTAFESTKTTKADGTMSTTEIRGTLSVSVSRDKLDDQDVLIESHAARGMDAAGGAHAGNTLLYLEQNAETADLRILAKNTSGDFFQTRGQVTGGAIARLKEPQIERPGEWKNGLDFSSARAYAGARPEDPAEEWRYVEVVIGSEVIRTGVGYVTAWKVSHLRTSATTTVNGTYWYAPQLGIYVRAEEAFVNSAAGTTGTRTLLLDATNVPAAVPAPS